MKVGHFFPSRPAPSGVADYASALAGALGARCELRPGGDNCDVALYHLGNNRLHWEIYQRALERPGVAVLHDAVLHHLLLGSLDRAAYIEEFVYNYGEPSREEAGQFWDARSRSAADTRYFERALVRRAAESSLAVVVHNPAAARIVREHATGAHFVEIPHLYQAPECAPDAAGWRAAHGIPPDAFLFGVFGYLRETKRLGSILRVFERLAHRDAWLLVAGEFTSTEYARSLAPALAAPRIVRAGFLAEPEFWRAAAAVDACVNLRSPSAGETSGIMIRLMGLAKPVLVTAGQEISRLPAGTVIPIDAGVAEIPMLTEYVSWLLAHREKGAEIGRCAFLYIASQHRLERVSSLYYELLESCCR